MFPARFQFIKEEYSGRFYVVPKKYIYVGMPRQSTSSSFMSGNNGTEGVYKTSNSKVV